MVLLVTHLYTSQEAIFSFGFCNTSLWRHSEIPVTLNTSKLSKALLLAHILCYKSVLAYGFIFNFCCPGVGVTKFWCAAGAVSASEIQWVHRNTGKALWWTQGTECAGKGSCVGLGVGVCLCLRSNIRQAQLVKSYEYPSQTQSLKSMLSFMIHQGVGRLKGMHKTA